MSINTNLHREGRVRKVGHSQGINSGKGKARRVVFLSTKYIYLSKYELKSKRRLEVDPKQGVCRE